MQRRPTLLKSIAIVSSLTAAPAAMSQLTAREYTNEQTYKYQVIDMPDFDQLRENGLQNQGRCYCGPTTACNLLAEFSGNGFPELPTGVPAGTGWADNANYQTITNMLEQMRVGLGNTFSPGGAGINGCGVGPRPLVNYLRDQYGAQFTFRVIWSETLYNVDSEGAGTEPHPIWLARYANLDGSIGALGRHLYDGTLNSSSNVFTATNKVSGHWQAVQSITANNGNVLLGLRNSGTQSAVNDIQGAFETEEDNVQYINFVDVDQDVAALASMGSLRMIGSPPANGNPPTFRAKVVVALFAMTPKVSYTWAPSLVDGMGCIETLQPEIVRWCPDLAPSRTACFNLPMMMPLTSVRTTPDGTDLMLLSGGEIHSMDRISGLVSQWNLPGNFSNAQAFAVLGSRHMFVASGASLGFFGIDNTTPDSSIWEVSLEKPISSIAIEDSKAYCLIPEMAQVRIYASTESGGWIETELNLPSSAGFANDSRIFASGNHLFVLSNETVQAYQVLPDGSAEPIELGQLPSNVTDIAVDDCGVVNFVVRDGEKFKCDSWRFLSDTSFTRQEDHPLHGSEVSERLISDRAMIEIPDLPDDMIETPDEADVTGVVVGDCLGDLNDDRQVDGGDLGLLLSSWGQSHSAADINNDGAVDGADLGLMLGAWGACEELVSGGVCCESTTEPGCTDMSCQTLVCASDPYCCETAWDDFCVEGAIEFCGSCE